MKIVRRVSLYRAVERLDEVPPGGTRLQLWRDK
jgi:hypothetical protein